VNYREEEVREEHRSALRKLLATDVFEMHYDDLDSAIATLEAMIGEDAQSSALWRNELFDQTRA
jgi:hypothetical protein